VTIRTESLSGNGDHCLKTGQSSKVDRVQRQLHKHSQAESVHRYATLGLDLAKEVGERKSTTECQYDLLHTCSVGHLTGHERRRRQHDRLQQ
jgi:hypothetical protein